MTNNWITDYIARNPAPTPCELPRRFQNADIGGIPPGRLKEVAQKYLQSFYEVAPSGIGCLFLGKAGTYKTYTACSILRRVQDLAHLESFFVSCPVALSQIERSRFSQTSEELITRIKKTPFVVMDDFSQIAPGSFGAGVLLEIAEARFSNLRPTIWTGNIHVPETSGSAEGVTRIITGLYGPSFGRRLTEASKGFGVVR